MIGDNIRKALERKGLTSNELAEKIGVTATYVSYLLNNKRNASIEVLEKIAEVLEVSVSSFFDSPSTKETKAPYTKIYQIGGLDDESTDELVIRREKDTEKPEIEIELSQKTSNLLGVIPEEFTDPSQARSYINKHQIFGSNGFNPDKLDDYEILEFANELLKQMKMVSYKYKK